MLKNNLKDQKKKLITMVGCNLRFNPFIKKIKKILDSKVLGKIYFVKAENGSFLPDWHPDEDYQRSYASSEKISGGLPLTLIHELDYLTWFFGEVDSLSSFGDKLSNLKISTNDISLTYLKFKNNVVAEIDLNIFQKPNYRSCKIIGSKAQLFWDTDSNKIKIYNYKSKKWSTKYHIKKYETNSMYKLELDYFLQSVKDNKETFNNVLDASKTMKIALIMKKSAKNKGVKL